MRILLQFPEGLKRHAMEHAERLERQGNEVFLLARATYGACDLPIEEAKAVKADKIIHFGHCRFGRLDIGIPIEYVPFGIRIDVDALNDFIEELKKQGIKRIGIATTAQHIGQLNEMKKLFAKRGIAALTKRGKLSGREGQVLGCDASALDINVKAIAIIADGMFHALAAANLGDKDAYSVNPYNGKWKSINKEIEAIRKRERAALAGAYSAKVFGILVSTKPGQHGMKAAESAKKEIEKRGRKAYILVSNELRAVDIDNFAFFDAYVNSACPRMIDDTASFSKPIINVGMLKELLSIWDAGKR
jgi:2-(3-amino-3-carboxypropyl)histidine synthase